MKSRGPSKFSPTAIGLGCQQFWEQALLDRQTNQQDFIARAGWQKAVINPMSGDVSTRIYSRLSNGPSPWRNAVLMDAGPNSAVSIRSFMAIGDWLRGQHFSAPQTIFADPEDGFLMLEDFGDNLFVTMCDNNPENEEMLYGAAIDFLRQLGRLPAPAKLNHGAILPVFNLAVFVPQTRIVLEHYAPENHTANVEAQLDALIADLCGTLSLTEPVLVLRDFHAENLIWLADRAGSAKVGLLDYQDALTGHPAYDLVSLLQDARRDVDPELEQEMLAYYRDATGADAEFDLHYALLGAQRNTKIIGIFTRLWKRDGKDRYLGFLPRMWGLLERDLAHPGLTELKAWFDKNIPADTRTQSPDSVPNS